VQELQGSYQVAVVGPNSTVEFRPVEVGEKVDSQWIIEKGVHPRERAVVAGLQKVTAGAVVQAKPPPADTASTVAANTTVQGQ
jgi:membrane fusion protein (multidrug efflux system)